MTTEALKSPWVLQPVYAGFSIVSPSWLWIVMPLLFLAVVIFSLAVSGAGWSGSGGWRPGSRRPREWQAPTATRRSVSPTRPGGYLPRSCIPGPGFSGWDPVLDGVPGGPRSRKRARPRRRPRRPGGRQRRRHGRAAQAPHVGYTSDVIEVVEQYVYRPVLSTVMALVRIAKRLQSGRLDAYLAYMLIALIALLALVARPELSAGRAAGVRTISGLTGQPAMRTPPGRFPEPRRRTGKTRRAAIRRPRRCSSGRRGRRG